ncbi:MAG: hypothetical protein RLZZ519_1935 [Bacteroidota bacterium]|jgi:hypothetical protein
MARNALVWLLGVLSVPLMAMVVHAQTPGLDWANTISSTTGVSEVNEVVIDPAGFVYSVGGFVGVVDFDPGVGTTPGTTPNGIWHGFVQKLDTNGNFIWARVFPGNDFTWLESIALDAAGNVLIAGSFSGTTDFDPGAGVANITSVGIQDMCLLKLNASGIYQWSKRVGAAGRFCIPYMLKADAAGGMVTVGNFDGPMDFNPGAGTVNLAPVGLEDVFVQKLDAAGNYVFAKKFGGGDYESAETVNIDAAGNLFTSGSFFSSTVDFDPGGPTVNVNLLGLEDFFIQKMNSAGNFTSVARIGGTGASVWGQSALDAAGNVYSGGSFDGTVDFDPGAGTVNLVAGGQSHGFVQKLNSSLAFQWVRQITCNNVIYNRAVTTDAAGNVYVVGDFMGTADFDPGVGVVSRSSPNQVTYFLKLNSAGTFVWVAILESGQYNFSDGVAVDPHTNVYGGGYHFGTTDFEPRAPTFFMTSDDNDSWLLKFGQSPLPLPVSELDLTAAPMPRQVDLSWFESAAIAVQRYDVQRSTDGLLFEYLGSVDDGLALTYSDFDVTPGIRYYYRLRLLDFNGAESYSEVVDAVVPEMNTGIRLVPNPAQGSVTIWADDAPLGKLSLTNSLGQVVRAFDAAGAVSYQLDLQGVARGLYWLQSDQLGQALPLQVD